MLNIGISGLVATIVTILASIKLTQLLLNRPKRTELKGPPSNGFLIGRSFDISKLTPNRGMIFEEWARDYGSIYRVPLVLGSSLVVICDIKAVSHVLTKDMYTYKLVPVHKRIFKASFGPGATIPEGDEHKKSRRKLAPSFSSTAIRGVTDVFYDSAYKLKTKWDAYFESITDVKEVTIDVQKWVGRLTIEAIGVAGFGYNFNTLDGNSPVMRAIEEFNFQEEDLLSRLTISIGDIFPVFLKFPTNQAKLFAKYRDAVSKTAKDIIFSHLEKRKLSSTCPDVKETFLLNIITKEKSGNEIEILEEMIANINRFVLAGSETTTIGITWALIELARHPNIQQKLREELRKFSDCEPNWNQLKSELRYLDAVVHETIRLHPSIETLSRSATEDDILPLSNPIQTASGEVVDSVMIPKGTIVILPHVFFNTSEEFWGPDAKQFAPNRWLRELTGPAKNIRGYRHLCTFSEGPRVCLGTDFAVTQLKVTLSVLIRNFTFELADEPSLEFDFHRSFLPRPKPVGTVGATTPMRIRQVAK